MGIVEDLWNRLRPPPLVVPVYVDRPAPPPPPPHVEFGRQLAPGLRDSSLGRRLEFSGDPPYQRMELGIQGGGSRQPQDLAALQAAEQRLRGRPPVFTSGR